MADSEKLQTERDYLLIVGVQRDIYLGPLLGTVQPDSLVIKDLNIKFSVKKNKDNKKASNRATISIYNLSQNSISFLNSSKLVNVSFYAGYKNSGMSSLVSGNITNCKTEKQGGDIVTTLTLDENFVAINNTVVTSTIPAGKTIEDVIEAIRREMSRTSEAQGGPLIQKGSYQGKRIKSKVLYGYPLTGQARQRLDEIALAYKLEWYIDNNALYVRDEGNETEKNETRTYVLSPETGLLDIPHFDTNTVTVTLATPVKTVSTGKDGKKKTTTKTQEKLEYIGVSFMALLNPFLRPGDLVKIECNLTKDFINSYYQVREIEYYGELRGNDWYIKCFCDEVTLIV